MGGVFPGAISEANWAGGRRYWLVWILETAAVDFMQTLEAEDGDIFFTAKGGET